LRRETGIVRNIDQLGRIVLPKELRKSLGIDINDTIEIFYDGTQISLKKYSPGCNFCGNLENLHHLRSGKLVCKQCIQDV
jgi:AbrB family transcriptional regulator, transcriptional pleiotropic regulator of transition state genes